MKKTLFVVALATILVLAAAGSAFALSANRLPGSNFGSASTALGANAYVYTSWANVSVLGGNVGATSPHGNYTTTTVKCAVCHAVHDAAAAKAPITSNYETWAAQTNAQQADTLLRVKADLACAYCHVQAGNTVDNDPVYGGDVANISSAGAHPQGSNGSAYCGECHTGPHGVNADQAPSLVGLILKNNPSKGGIAQPTGGTSGVRQSAVVSSAVMIDANATAEGFAGPVTGFTAATYLSSAGTWTTLNGKPYNATRQQAIGIFCAECHDGSYAQTVSGASASLKALDANGNWAQGSTLGSGGELTGHRTMATASANWGASGNVHSSGQSNGGAGFTVAFASATECRSCHDADNGFYTGKFGFPHYSPNTQDFMYAAASSNSPTENIAANDSSHGGPSEDGACLKCHRGGTGTVGDPNATITGVGVSF